jgi:hypothetical protein
MRSRKGTRGLVSHAPLLIPISASDPLRRLAGWYWPEFWVAGLSRQQLSPERPGHKSLTFRRRGAGENRRVWGSRYRRGPESQGSQWTLWWEQDPNPRSPNYGGARCNWRRATRQCGIAKRGTPIVRVGKRKRRHQMHGTKVLQRDEARRDTLLVLKARQSTEPHLPAGTLDLYRLGSAPREEIACA